MIANLHSLNRIRIFLDLFLLNIAFVSAAYFAQPIHILFARNYMFSLLLLLNIIWLLTTKSTSFYEEFTSQRFYLQFITLVKNVFIQVLASIVFIFSVKEDLFTRNFIIFDSVFVVTFVSLRIIFLKLFLQRIGKSSKFTRSVVIIGAGEIGKSFYDILKNNPDFGYNFIGFIDNNANTSYDTEIIGSLSQLQKILNERFIDEVIIALPENESGNLEAIIKRCNKSGVRIHIVPDYFKFLAKKFKIGTIGNFPLITLRDEPLEELHWKILKRAFDLFISVIVIISVTWWLFFILGMIQKLTSKGPIFFIQDRVGKNNKSFKCYKFRTMEAKSGNEEFLPASKDDPRINMFGKFLRKTNLDELPQIFNVFRGDMSLVGPRPHAIPYDNLYGEYVDELKLRTLVKPGITGWAQIHGLRGDVPDKEENKLRTRKRIEHDIWYIENWSPWLDIQIILLTILQMIQRKNLGN
ncbi:MAG: undecaprenyl-phosphate glucose phosphotransferase [bacterium]